MFSPRHWLPALLVLFVGSFASAGSSGALHQALARPVQAGFETAPQPAHDVLKSARLQQPAESDQDLPDEAAPAAMIPVKFLAAAPKAVARLVSVSTSIMSAEWSATVSLRGPPNA